MSCWYDDFILLQNNNDVVVGPLTVESVMAKLYNNASQWKEIAETIGFPEYLIDEIETNNMTAEACLKDIVEQCMKHRASLEKLYSIVNNLGS